MPGGPVQPIRGPRERIEAGLERRGGIALEAAVDVEGPGGESPGHAGEPRGHFPGEKGP